MVECVSAFQCYCSCCPQAVTSVRHWQLKRGDDRTGHAIILLSRLTATFSRFFACCLLLFLCSFLGSLGLIYCLILHLPSQASSACRSICKMRDEVSEYGVYIVMGLRPLGSSGYSVAPFYRQYTHLLHPPSSVPLSPTCLPTSNVC